MAGEVRRFPVRERQGVHEVLIVPEDTWLQCHSKEEARAIAAAPVLEFESLEGHCRGEAFASELEKTAAALEKHRIGFGSRFFRRRAEEARASG